MLLGVRMFWGEMKIRAIRITACKWGSRYLASMPRQKLNKNGAVGRNKKAGNDVLTFGLAGETSRPINHSIDSHPLAPVLLPRLTFLTAIIVITHSRLVTESETGTWKRRCFKKISLFEERHCDDFRKEQILQTYFTGAFIGMSLLQRRKIRTWNLVGATEFAQVPRLTCLMNIEVRIKFIGGQCRKSAWLGWCSGHQHNLIICDHCC